MAIQATRLGNGPIIYPEMGAEIGTNINGPSVIRIPDWVLNKLGTYYMYFADHMGTYIRLAYADAITGPWVVHQPGVLDVKDSLFVPTDPVDPPRSEWPDWVPDHADRFLYAHVASPDVHIDEDARQIKMYYHGLLEDGEQMTRLASSTDGLSFAPHEEILGPCYFRVFSYNGLKFALSWGGDIYRSRSWTGSFESGPNIFKSPPLIEDGRWFRHCAVLCRDDRLDLFYSRIADAPERILHSKIKLASDWSNWKIEEHGELLRPELDWEGADLPISISIAGGANGREHALRDPCIFTENGAHYLFYCGAAESAIGVASVKGL